MSIARLAPWRGMMRQVITVAPRSGQDSFGVPTYGTAVTYRCRLVGKRRQVLNAAGQMVVSDQTAYLFSADNVLPDAQVTLSTADVGSTESFDINPKLLAVERRFDEEGPHHVVLYAGWAPRSV